MTILPLAGLSTTPGVTRLPPTAGRMRSDGTGVLGRVNRAYETAPSVVARAVPAGSVRAANPSQTLRALEDHPEFALFYRNRQAGLRAVVRALGAHAEWSTMTARPGHARLAAMSGIPERTMQRHLRTLRDFGLVGVVATGRPAELAEPGPDGLRINEAAVYVLCAPAPLAAVDSGAVDENGGPSRVSGRTVHELSTTTHARVQIAEGASPIHESEDLPARRVPVCHWPETRAPATRRQRWAAGAQLRVVALPLRALSARDVASVCRDFFAAGWSVRDVAYAIDHSPAGPRRMLSLDLEDGSARVRGWLRWRLASWRGPDGAVAAPRSQRALAAAQAAREAAAAAQVALEAARVERAALVGSPGRAAGLAAVRAALAEAQEKSA